MSEQDDRLLSGRLKAHLDRIASHPIPTGLEERVAKRLFRATRGRGLRLAAATAVALVTAAALTLILAVGIRSHQTGTPGGQPAPGNHIGSAPSPTVSPVTQGTPLVPVPRRGGALAYDGVGQRMLMFGDDTLTHQVLDRRTYAWTRGGWRVLSPAVSPPARTKPGMAWDPKDHVVILFGSQAYPEHPAFSDTWSWDGSTWKQLMTTSGPQASDNPQLTWDEATGQLLLTGVGSKHSTAPGTNPWRSETWVWRSGTWVLADYVTTPQTSQPQTAYDPVTKRTVMLTFPTGQGNDRTDTMYSWSGSRWERMSAQVPQNLWSLATDYGRGRIIGVRPGGGTFAWSGSAWSQVHPEPDDNAFPDIAFAWDPEVNAVAEYGVGLNEVQNGVKVGTNNSSSHIFLWSGSEWQPQTDEESASTGTPSAASSASPSTSMLTTPGDAERIIRATVTQAVPVLIPSAVPSNWSAQVSATSTGFSVTYIAPNGVDQNIHLELAVTNPPPPGPHGTQSAPKFHGDAHSLYQVADSTRVDLQRFLLWTEPGRWSVEARGGVPYTLWTVGFTDAEFWRIADSLR